MSFFKKQQVKKYSYRENGIRRRSNARASQFILHYRCDTRIERPVTLLHLSGFQMIERSFAVLHALREETLIPTGIT